VKHWGILPIDDLGVRAALVARQKKEAVFISEWKIRDLNESSFEKLSSLDSPQQIQNKEYQLRITQEFMVRDVSTLLTTNGTM
jgi:hypothetical protein